jgi:putative heme-binding domain-containing protein
VQLNDGRTLNGVAIAQSDRTITLKMQNETIVIDRKEIEEIQESNLSLMPDGILESLAKSDARDLVAYLMHPNQVPLKNEP